MTYLSNARLMQFQITQNLLKSYQKLRKFLKSMQKYRHPIHYLALYGLH